MFSELKENLLVQLSRTLDDRLDADERKQADSLQQLHANLVAEALKSFGEKLEAESAKQQQAIAELQASLAPQPVAAPEVLHTVTPEVPDAVTLEAPNAAAIEPEIHSHEAEETLPPVVAPQTHEEILELDQHAAAEHAEIHDDHHVDEATPSSVAEPVFAHASGATFGAEALQPAAVFAHDDASAQGNPNSFLSAARQSLQAAATKTEPNGKSNDLFSLPFMRTGAAREKGKGETTSYALLAGVVLVAILAVAVTAGELISRSSPSGDIHRTPATIPAAKHAAIVHAATKVASAAPVKVTPTVANKTVPAQANNGDTKRQLAVLANAGDSQAQMLLGLQQLTGPDKAQAMSWLERAAASGEPVA